jgi:hypothetical protein
LKSALSNEPFFTFEEMTALLRSWRVPTLFLGTASVAATPAPLRATSRAIHATTSAGDGRLLRMMLRIDAPFRRRFVIGDQRARTYAAASGVASPRRDDPGAI